MKLLIAIPALNEARLPDRTGARAAARPLAFLRGLEPTLVRVPLGAQYHVVATKPGDP